MSAIMKITSSEDLLTDVSFYSYSTITFFEDAYTIHSNILRMYSDFNLTPHWIEYKDGNPIYCYMLNNEQYRILSTETWTLKRKVDEDAS